MISIEKTVLNSDLKKFFYKGFEEHAVECTGADGDISETIVYLAKRSEKLVGGIAVSFFWGALHLKYLYVAKETRGLGIGKQLIEKVFSFAKEHQCPLAFVETMNFQAVDFYQKFGFTQDFVRHGYANRTSLHYLTKRFLIDDES